MGHMQKKPHMKATDDWDFFFLDNHMSYKTDSTYACVVQTQKQSEIVIVKHHILYNKIYSDFNLLL